MVEFQQEEAQRKRKTAAAPNPEEQDRIARRRSLELARSKAAGDLARAKAPAHRAMLEQALAALDEQLRQL
jgi:hypothetical protein